MKVRIAYTVDVSDEYRRAICRYYGEEGMATREDVQRWFKTHGESMNDDVMFECSDASMASQAERTKENME